MVVEKQTVESIKATQFHLRKLAKSGNSRYLSVGTLLPKEWLQLKVYVEKLDSSSCVLRIEPIE